MQVMIPGNISGLGQGDYGSGMFDYDADDMMLSGLGAAWTKEQKKAIRKAHFRSKPVEGFPYMFEDDEGKIRYATETGAKILRASEDWTEIIPWYRNPLILGGIALAVGATAFVMWR